MHQVTLWPGELAADCSWQGDTTQLEMYPVLRACYCWPGSYTQNLQLLQDAMSSNNTKLQNDSDGSVVLEFCTCTADGGTSL